MTTSELINGLRVLLASEEDCDEAIRAVAAVIKESGIVVEIDTDDDGPDALSGGDYPLWVTSTHCLKIDTEEVANWTRCAVGRYGEAGRQCSDDQWCIDEDTDGGDVLPDKVAVALDALGVDDDIPDVPEPDKADEIHTPDPAGEYAVYWETVGDDAHVVSRYESLDAAEAVCAQRNREFAARNPSGGGTTYLCGFGVRTLIDGKWVATNDQE